MGLIVVKSQVVELVKEINKERNLKINNITTDFPEALDKKVRILVREAMQRAHENNRKTLMGRDI